MTRERERVIMSSEKERVKRRERVVLQWHWVKREKDTNQKRDNMTMRD